MANETTLELNLSDGKAWSFPQGDWTEKDGVITPPELPRYLHSRAFYKPRAFTDLVAEFEYNPNYRDLGHGLAGFIFRAQDANHCYMVHFPWGGQQLRAKHFWAAISKVDGDGYIRNIKMQYVPGLPSETDRWYQVRIEVKGSSIDVTVDGRKAVSATDTTYQSGCVGLMGQGWYMFRNVRVTGSETDPPPWNDKLAIPEHFFELPVSSKIMPTVCVAPNGDVLLGSGDDIYRSTDKARTWRKQGGMPQWVHNYGGLTDYRNTMFCTAKGRLLIMFFLNPAMIEQPKPKILIAESTDNGHTWAAPVQMQTADGWDRVPKTIEIYGPLVETADGTLLRFLFNGAKEGETKFTNVVTWGAIRCKAYAMRSTDGGLNWSAPIEIDQPYWVNSKRGEIIGALDLTETTGVAIGNKVMLVIRPIYSQQMWQCWSDDAGANWDAAARTTFPGYAQSMVRLKSGAILVAHRYPNYSVNISWDDGLNWDAGTIIDYPAWAMGTFTEIEPDVLLATYMNRDLELPLLAQIIRVKPGRIEPVLTTNK